MTTKTKRGGAVAFAQGSVIPPEFYMGDVAITSIPDEPVSAAKLSRAWAGEGLDPSLIPDARNPVHAFQAACRSVETRRGKNGSEVKVDEVLESANECVYQITRLVRDKNNRVIEHPKAMRMVFDKWSEDISAEPLSQKTYAVLARLEDEIVAHYTKNATKIPGAKIRMSVRALMKQVGAELLRKTGSAYFVPADGHDTMVSVKKVLEHLYGDKAMLYLFPVGKDEAAREMVREAHTINAVQEAEEKLAEVMAYVKKGTVRKDKLGNLMLDRRALGQRVRQYSELLQDDLKEVEAVMETLDESFEKLMVMGDQP